MDSQRSINLYPEKVESADGKDGNQWCLVGAPGLAEFTQLPSSPIRGMYVALGRLFVVAGNNLYEVFNNGQYSVLGTIYTNACYVGMADNGIQLGIVDGLHEYILTFSTNAFQADPAGATFLGSAVIAFLDGYFVFAKPQSNEFFISALNDGTAIDGLDVAQKEGASDNIVSVLNLHRQLHIFGESTTEVWYNSGSNDFPLAPIQGVYIETGSAAAFALQKVDNTAIWVGKDPRGQGIVYRLQGYSPVRISTHAIEKLIQSMGDLGNLIAYTYQEEGHSFYVLNAPGASTTLVYDSTTGEWHERQYHGTDGLTRHRASFYAFAFNLHLMGDWQNGMIYISSLDIYDYNGAPRRCIRRAPHLSNNMDRVFYDFFQVDMETGVGLDGSGQGTDPQMLLRYSNDGGHTFGQERRKSIGKIGEYKARAYWNQLGQARDRVFEVEIADPVKVVLVGAKIGATGGKS